MALGGRVSESISFNKVTSGEELARAGSGVLKVLLHPPRLPRGLGRVNPMGEFEGWLTHVLLNFTKCSQATGTGARVPSDTGVQR